MSLDKRREWFKGRPKGTEAAHATVMMSFDKSRSSGCVRRNQMRNVGIVCIGPVAIHADAGKAIAAIVRDNFHLDLGKLISFEELEGFDLDLTGQKRSKTMNSNR